MQKSPERCILFLAPFGHRQFVSCTLAGVWSEDKSEKFLQKNLLRADQLPTMVLYRKQGYEMKRSRDLSPP